MSKGISKWARTVWEYYKAIGEPTTPEAAVHKFGTPEGKQTAAELLSAATRAGYFRRERTNVATKSIYIPLREPVVYVIAKEPTPSFMDGLMVCNSIFDLGARYAQQNSREA